MVGELGQLRAVRAHHEDVCVVDAFLLRLAAAGDEQPLAVGRQLRGGEAPARLGEDDLFHSRLEVDSPYLALVLVGEAGAVDGVIVARNEACRHSA